MELRDRIEYLKFRRLVWIAEMLLAILIMIVAFLFDARREVFVFILWLCSWRVLTEIVNYLSMAELFNMEDRWRVLFLLY